MTDYYKDGQQMKDELKPFDISEYEFSDDKLSLLISDADLISINDNCSGSCFDLYKDDVIALAKHFNLTAEDLK